MGHVVSKLSTKMITKEEAAFIDRIEKVKAADILSMYCCHRGCVESLNDVGDYCLKHDPNPNCKACQTDVTSDDSLHLLRSRVAELETELAGIKKRKRKPKVIEPEKRAKGTPLVLTPKSMEELAVHSARID